eukprot:96708-Heterocapsa_arctica.AAC.1
MGAGIRQGCPASGTLWAIAFDPILRSLIAALDTNQLATVGGFADDLGIAVDDPMTALPLTVSFFQVVKLAAGLQLNLKKTQ